MVSIPLGLVVGILLSALLLSVVRAAFGETFTFSIVELSLKVNGLILLVSGLSGIASLYFGSRKPVKQAAKITVIEAIRQSNNAVSKRNSVMENRFFGFGIYGSLAAKILSVIQNASEQLLALFLVGGNCPFLIQFV